MKKSSLFALATVLIALLGPIEARAALMPCDRDIEDKYHTGVNKQIDDAVALKSSLHLTTYPSFKPESGLRVVGSEIYLVEFQTQFWADSYVTDRQGNMHMDFTKPKITVKTHHARLDTAVIRRVERIYFRAIAGATRNNQMGLDGVSYVFAEPNGVCGWAWSPDPGTPNGHLVELMKRLKSHTKFSTPMDLQRSEISIVRYLTSIEEK